MAGEGWNCVWTYEGVWWVPRSSPSRLVESYSLTSFSVYEPSAACLRTSIPLKFRVMFWVPAVRYVRFDAVVICVPVLSVRLPVR